MPHVPELKLHNISTNTAEDLSKSHPLYQPVIDDLASYSITPRTIARKTLIVANTADNSPVKFEEVYKYEGNSVTRFGIYAQNITATRTTGAGGEILGEQVFFTNQTGSRTSNSSKYTVSQAQNAKLHRLEEEIITKAIQHLNLITTSTVLVDIFERDKGETINLDAQDHPVTHTIVLYKGQTTIQVIDPSNFIYSSHVSNTYLNNSLTAQRLPIIESKHKVTQIYTPNKTTGIGPRFDQYRDCTDIAVKLAFGFNKTPIDDFNNIKGHTVVVRVSNNDDIDTTIIEPKIASRIKQTSSIVAQEIFIKTQAIIDDRLNTLKKIKVAGTLEQEYTNILQNSSLSLNDTFTALYSLDEKYNSARQILQDQFDEYRAELAGQDESSAFCLTCNVC
jgi:hypothetical protein